MIKPYFAIAALIALLVVFGFGYRTGSNAVTVKYQADIAKQNAEAQQIINDNNDKLQTLQVERDTIKSKLENERQANVKTTNDLRTKLASTSLRFKSSTGGKGSTDSLSETTNTASNTNSTSTELPTTITASLRELAYDCDTLRDDYALLYNFVRDVK
jgi:hypothetical protein